MKIAIQGCCHGQLDDIYSHIQQLERRNNYKVDALLICGDFQATRNHQDLQCMAVPAKYRELQTFYKYYTGEKVAPVPTIVIGGNHEASNYFWELYHGGWVAPNIYFLGHAGAVRLNGVRIAGSSGIYKQHDFRLGHYEKIPYDSGAMRSIYHVREYCVRKLSLLSSNDIFLSHDWPNAIEQYGDTDDLLRRKVHFRPDVEKGQLGSPPLMGLLQTLRPEWWFSAHMHTRFEATVTHDPLHGVEAQAAPVQKNPDEIQIDDDDDVPSASSTKPEPINPDEITLDDEEATVEAPPPPPAQPSVTKFLALDKCGPRKSFLEVVDIPTPQSQTASPPLLAFDPEWLAISRAFHPWLSTTKQQPQFPDEATARSLVAKELEWVKKNVKTDANGEIPVSNFQTFVTTAPGPGSEGKNKMQQPPWYTNPQTVAFCQMLDIPNKINTPPANANANARARTPAAQSPRAGGSPRTVQPGVGA